MPVQNVYSRVHTHIMDMQVMKWLTAKTTTNSYPPCFGSSSQVVTLLVKEVGDLGCSLTLSS